MLISSILIEVIEYFGLKSCEYTLFIRLSIRIMFSWSKHCYFGNIIIIILQYYRVNIVYKSFLLLFLLSFSTHISLPYRKICKFIRHQLVQEASFSFSLVFQGYLKNYLQLKRSRQSFLLILFLHFQLLLPLA